MLLDNFETPKDAESLSVERIYQKARQRILEKTTIDIANLVDLVHNQANFRARKNGMDSDNIQSVVENLVPVYSEYLIKNLHLLMEQKGVKPYLELSSDLASVASFIFYKALRDQKIR